jgi:DNA repair ATPase RecN
MSTTPPPATARTATPYSINDLHDLNIVLDIFRGLEHRLSVVETIAKFHSEKIEQLTQWMIASPNLEEDVERNTKDLHDLERRLEKDVNELGRRLGRDVNDLAVRHDNKIHELEKVDHTVKSLGKIALAVIAGGGLVYFLTHFPEHWSH